MSWFSKLFGGEKHEGSMAMDRGMHAGHGGMNMGSQHSMSGTTMKTASGTKMTRDPVCGMDVATDKAAATSTHQGQTYYFCAMGCKKSFDKDPDKYLMGKGGMKGGCCD